MHSVFAPIIDNLSAIISHGGYVVLFLATVVEALPILGQFVPGHTLVILSGFLAKLGVLHIGMVIPLVIVGAVIGDGFGYWFGKKFGFVFLERFGKYFFVQDKHIEKMKEVVQTHTGKTIILGRLSPVTRTLAPFVVGASGVPAGKFFLYDIFGVIAWAVASIILGYAFGASYQVAALAFGKFIVVAVIMAVLIVWGYHFVNKRLHIFKKYELVTLIFNLLGLYIFFKTVQDAMSEHSFMAGLDVWINIFFTSHASAGVLTFMNILTDIFSPESVVIVGGLGILYFLYKRYWRYALVSILTFGGGMFLNGLMKDIALRARPMDAFIVETGYSFPSGHAVSITLLCTLLIYFFVPKIQRHINKELFITACVLTVMVTAFSRIYLGVHWLSDVVAGIGFGIFWTTLMILFVRYGVGLVQTLRGER